MSRRANTRYPHAFSKGRRGPGVVSDGSWRLAPDDPRRTMFDAKPTVGFLSAKTDHTLASLIPRQLGLGIRCNQCRPGHDKILRPLEAVASYGGLVTFDEVAELLKRRCKKSPCVLSVFVSKSLIP